MTSLPSAMPPIVLRSEDPALFGALLWLLLALFLLRVLGQVVVAAVHPRWLPEMKQWYSGLIPYPLLLPIQIVFLWVMLEMVLEVTRGAGGWLRPGRGTAAGLGWFSYLYAGAMVIRFLRWRRTPPERRRAFIPILFHVVLAAFLFVFASFYLYARPLP